MREKFIFDHPNNKMFIQRTEDVEGHIDDVTGQRNHMDNGWSQKRNFRKIGSIPMIIVEKTLREKGINLMENSPEAQKEARKILNEMNKFRTVDKLV